jgi:hypothetical protein
LRCLTPPEKIANRTVADEYFAVTEKSKPFTGKANRLYELRGGHRVV